MTPWRPIRLAQAARARRILHDSDAPQVILKTTLIVAATELPSDFSPLKATLVFPIKAVIDEGLKEFKIKKNPAWAQCQSVKS